MSQNKKLIILLILICLVLIPAKAYGKNSTSLMLCFNKASNLYNVPASILLAIADVESGFNPYAIDVEGISYFPDSYNQAINIVDKYRGSTSIDIGIMQVNSFWFNRLNYPLSYGLEPCNDIYLGAYVLARKIARYGYNWRGIAAYHSNNHTAGLVYANKVYAVLREIGGDNNG
ncbi:MAG: lytic transglycosylase domain-containing protein [bacterium]